SAEKALYDTGCLLGRGESRIAHGRKFEASCSYALEGAVGAHVTASHASTTHETDGDTTHALSPKHQVTETFHRSMTSSGSVSRTVKPESPIRDRPFQT